MTGTELFFWAVAFALVGGFRRLAQEARDLLDTLRPPGEIPRGMMEFPRYSRRHPPDALWTPPPPGQPERTQPMPAAPPPPPPPGFFEREVNPDHNEYDKDSQLGGVSSHVPEPPSGEGDDET